MLAGACNNPHPPNQLWQRYFSFITLSGLTAARLRGSCGAFYRVEGTAVTIIVGVVDFVLVVTFWTLYARSRLVLVFLTTLAILEMLAMMIVDGITITIGMRGFYHTLDISTTPLCNTPSP
ncbi:hypothetical protein BD779DRAFT_166317 [Infundibulicybe gibba]|nr:hypothetical protein BD779DRAFT_166317 [Infundibulicybe gibba]